MHVRVCKYVSMCACGGGGRKGVVAVPGIIRCVLFLYIQHIYLNTTITNIPVTDTSVHKDSGYWLAG